MTFEGTLLNWKLFTGDGKSELKEQTPADAVSSETNELSGSWTMPGGWTVRVQWTRSEDGLSGTLSFQGLPSGEYVEQIHFPILQIPFGKRNDLFLPVSSGMVVKGENLAKRTEPYCYTFNSMQYLAVLGDPGIYASVQDPEHWFKKYQCRTLDDGKTLELRFLHYLPLSKDFSPDGKLPYTVEVRPFSGSWYDAAVIYRKWAEKQRWYQAAKSKKQRVRDIALWIWNRTDADHVAPPAEKIHADLNLPVALDWYFWQNKPNCTDYPLFWPPRDGVEKYSATLNRLKQNGIHTMTYLNGTNWDLHGAWAEQGKPCGVLRRDGTYQYHWYGTFNKRPLGDVCGDRGAFHEELTKQIEKQVKSGVQSVYLDVFGYLAFDCCYNPLHRHAPGGGAYYAEGYRRYLTELKKRFPDTCFSTEYASETFVDLLDSMIVLCHDLYGHWSAENAAVPAFNAVYHGLTALFGTYTTIDGRMPVDRRFWPADFPGIWKEEQEKEWRKLYPEQFYFNIARMLVDGYVPSIHGLTMEHCTSEKYAEEYGWLKKAAEFYHDNLEYLYDGEMLSPDGFECETIRFRYFVRFILMTPDQCHEEEAVAPAVLHGVWKSSSGRKALFAVNYTGQPRSFRYRGKNGEIPPLGMMKLEIASSGGETAFR